MKNNRKISYEDLDRIIQSSPDPYLILDADLVIVDVSDKYLEATMVERDAIIGKGIFQVFPDNPADLNATGVANLTASLKRVLTFKKADTMAVQKYDIRRPGEEEKFEERYWSPINSPVLDENGEVKYIIHRVKDVTEFVKLQAAKHQEMKIRERLLENNEIMEMEIIFRAQELQKLNEELRIAQSKAELMAQQAEADNRSKSVFLATMSHEIRTSLNGVIGMTELLLDTELSPQQLEYAETIRVSGEALLSIINNVLDYSKIESGNFQLDNIPFELQFVLDQTMEIILGQAYRKRIEIGSFIEPNVPPWFEGDPMRIRQILNNLLCNAVKFTSQGEITIWVKIKERKSDAIILLFEITDTGVGMDKESLTHLFQPFSQANPQTAIKYGGTGLGLCISKQLIELMNGEISVKSEVGKGTTFTFTIQLKESKQNFSSSYEPIPEFNNARILCVDDNRINCQIIGRLLTSWGIRCDIVTNPTKFITMLVSAMDAGDPYTLVFMDDCMRHMNSMDLIKIIRKMKEIANTNIIMMLSLGFPFNQTKLGDFGVQHYITKPIHPKRLFAQLENIILNKPQLTPAKKTDAESKKQKLKARILLVEDNFINQQICSGILNKFDLKPDIVDSGFKAVEAYKNQIYDLILMDCQMPGMDGYETTKEIRKLENNSIHVPIIAMTAHALKGDKEKCLEAGMDDYISKPIEVKKLFDILNKWLHEETNK